MSENIYKVFTVRPVHWATFRFPQEAMRHTTTHSSFEAACHQWRYEELAWPVCGGYELLTHTSNGDVTVTEDFEDIHREAAKRYVHPENPEDPEEPARTRFKIECKNRRGRTVFNQEALDAFNESMNPPSKSALTASQAQKLWDSNMEYFKSIGVEHDGILHHLATIQSIDHSQ